MRAFRIVFRYNLFKLDSLFKTIFLHLSDILPIVVIGASSLFIKLLHINKKTKSLLLPGRIFRLRSCCSIRSHAVAMMTNLLFTQATSKRIHKKMTMKTKSQNRFLCRHSVSSCPTTNRRAGAPIFEATFQSLVSQY